MTTIKDVAKAADVAVSTASMALRNDPRVKESTRLRVMEAAKTLRYMPNGIARDLKVRKTGIIGILLRDLGGPFYSELIRGAQGVAHAQGYEMIASGTARDKPTFASRMLQERRVDGVIVLSPDVEDETIVQVASADLPIVVLDRDLQREHIYVVRADNQQGGYMATKHLLELGYRDIIYVSGPKDTPDNVARYKGFLNAFKDFGLEPAKVHEYQGDFTEDSGYSAALWMRSNGKLPEAVFSANDEMAIGLLRAFQEIGVKVPDQVAVVGFDDIRLAEFLSPPLTTVRQPMYNLGVLAAHMLFRAIQGEVELQRVTLPTELIVRQSTRKW